jgi:hypothetical protein
MKYLLFLFFIFLYSGRSLWAQSSIFDELAIQEPGKGTVTIHQSAAIRSLVGQRSFDEKTETVGEKSYLVMPGYRIQVFSGNLRTSMAEAQEKADQIKNRFSDISTDITFTAPFWRLCVGDFLSYEEAFLMMSKLIEAFPAFKREMQIQKEEIRILLN